MGPEPGREIQTRAVGILQHHVGGCGVLLSKHQEGNSSMPLSPFYFLFPVSLQVGRNIPKARLQLPGGRDYQECHALQLGWKEMENLFQTRIPLCQSKKKFLQQMLSKNPTFFVLFCFVFCYSIIVYSRSFKIQSVSAVHSLWKRK